MQHDQFETLVQSLCSAEGLPQALEQLKGSDNEEVAAAAQALTGQFRLAEMDGTQRIYHVSMQENEDGEQQEYVEWIMNQGDDVITFVAWFFYDAFEIKAKDVYLAAGRSYQQPKRS